MDLSKISFKKFGNEIIEDSSLLEDQTSLFYKIQNKLLDANLLALIQKDEASLLISYPGVLGHTIFSWKSPQGTSWVIAGADISIRSTYCLAGDESNKLKSLSDVRSISLDGKLTQGKYVNFLSDMKLSMRSKLNASQNFFLSYSNLEPFLYDGESFSKSMTHMQYAHNLDKVKSFNPDFLAYLELAMANCLPTQRPRVHQMVSEGFENNLQKQAKKMLGVESKINLPKFDSNLMTPNEYSFELTNSYLRYFGLK